VNGEARPTMSAEAFVAVVGTYADRVHDDVRRLGATPAEAAEIVRAAALDVLDEVAVVGCDVAGAVGRWFAQARVLACRVADADDRPRSPDPDASAEAPEGLIRDTDIDLAARRGLAALDSRDRTALLLRDSYGLPEGATAIALGLDPSASRALVVAARRRFAEVADLRNASEVPLLLRGLAILALPDAERDEILRRVERAAGGVLPSDAELAELSAYAEARGGPSIATVAVSVTVAVLLGALAGLITAPPETDAAGALATGALPPTAEPFDVRKVDPAFATPTASPSPTSSPTPTATPTPTAKSTATSSPSPTAAPTRTAEVGPATITLSPTSGPDCTLVRVSGRSFVPGASIDVSYADPLGRPTPSGTTATVEPDGRFSVRFPACDPNRLPGPHRVIARSGGQEAAATFTATS